MLYSTPGWLQTATQHTVRVQKHRWWRPLLWAGLLTLSLLLAWQVATSGALLAADTISMSEPWRFVDESKPGSPMITGELVTVAQNIPAQENAMPVAAHFALNSTMQALALQFHYVDLAGLPLAHVEELGYCTRLIDGPRPYAVTLQVNVDSDVTDGDGDWQGRLVYTPSYNGAVIQGEWQCWNTLVGKWWATGGPVAQYAAVDNPQPLGTLLARFPNLGISATYTAVTLKAGDGWSHFEGEATPVVIGVEGERIHVAFGSMSQSSVVLLPVLSNEEAPQNPQDKEKKKEEKEQEKQERKEDKNSDDDGDDEGENAESRGIGWGNFDWENIDWSKVDWGLFGWRGEGRVAAMRAFVADVQQCKDDGWQAAGFNNAGACVAYYVKAHTPDDFDWENFDWNKVDWEKIDWGRNWNDRNDRNDNERGNRDGRGGDDD